jgi:pyruvate-formate lyase
MNELIQELRDYYSDFRMETIQDTIPEPDRAAWVKIINAMELYLAQNPDIHPSLLKARLHEEIADNFVPKIFPHSPFFYEMGMRPAEFWGIPFSTDKQPASWMHNHFLSLLTDTPEADCFNTFMLHHCEEGVPALWSGRLGFDEDHHCLGYTALMRTGINGILEKISSYGKKNVELQAMERGCRALLHVASRFREQALELLKTETDSEAIANLYLIADTAKCIPAEPPKTFYEGLAMLWFLREVIASLESIGISVIGHVDRLLIDLYTADIASGTLTEAKARKLIAQWMLPNDIKTFAKERKWPETSTCMMLGGCDEYGKPVWNDLTRMFIEVHCELDLINPKLNCRFSANSPQAYLNLVAEKNLVGYNNFALLNDDVLISSLVKYGKTEPDARLYVNGGCQETICEGVEHSAGAYYYFNMPELFHVWFTGNKLDSEKIPAMAAQALPEQLTRAESFEEFYSLFMTELKRIIGQGAEWSVANGVKFPQINPCPLFSTTLEGCIEQGEDYKSGGAKYNPSGVTLVGLADVINSLIAVKQAVFEEEKITLEQLQRIVAGDWSGYEYLRQQVMAYPRFGHGIAEVDALASRFAAEIAEYVRTVPNERGEHFQPSFFVYWSFKTFGNKTGATPDGRRDGDMFSQGIAPHREHAPKNLTDVINSLRVIDFTDYPGNAVLDIQLPAGGKIPAEMLVSFCRVAAEAGIPTLQLNCVDASTMRRAQEHPEEYPNLLVRISGLSAIFVQLNKEVQDELISRASYAV